MIDPDLPLLLGSASPRRRAILVGLGIPLRVVAGEAAESVRDGETPARYLRRVVASKLESVAPRVGPEPFAALLVADTIVVVDREILGKPHDIAEARSLLGRLVGRAHDVFTRYAVSRASAPLEPVAERSTRTRVVMRAAARDEVERYAATGEGLDKAGAYAAQGIGAFLIERVHGSYTNVVGLPACELILDLRATGLLPRFP